MGFFSDFLTWLKGRNLRPSLMNDKQELEKLGEYEEENGLTGQLYQHTVTVVVSGQNDDFEFTYYAVNNIPDKYAVITTGSNIEVPDFNNELYQQGFVFVKGIYQPETIFTAWEAHSYESGGNAYTWSLTALARGEFSAENLAINGWSIVSTETGERVSLTETVTPFNPR